MVTQGGNQISEDQIPVEHNELAGAIAGQVDYWQINLGGIKIFVMYFDDYENDTTNNQSITFPIAYQNTPTLVLGNSTLPSMSATATVLTITSPDSTTLYNGTAFVIGY